MEYTGSTIAVYNDQNVAIECDIVSMFENEDTGKHYMVYTDNSTNDIGESNLFVVSFRPDLEEDKLYPVETEEEWNTIAPFLLNLKKVLDEHAAKAAIEPTGCSPSCCASCGSSCGE